MKNNCKTATALFKSFVVLTSLSAIPAHVYLLLRIMQDAVWQAQHQLEEARNAIADHLQYSVVLKPQYISSHFFQTGCYLNVTDLSLNQSTHFPINYANNRSECNAFIDDTGNSHRFLISQIILGIGLATVPSIAYWSHVRRTKNTSLILSPKDFLMFLLVSSPTLLAIAAMIWINYSLPISLQINNLTHMLASFCQTALPIQPENNTHFQYCNSQQGTFFLNNFSANDITYQPEYANSAQKGFDGMQIVDALLIPLAVVSLTCAIHFVRQCIHSCKEALVNRHERDGYDVIGDDDTDDDNAKAPTPLRKIEM